jgi:hypothetical protein
MQQTVLRPASVTPPPTALLAEQVPGVPLPTKLTPG